MERFRDRSDAGRQLAAALMHLKGCNPMVLGLARGGVEVGAEVAKALEAPLDVLIARKVGAPRNPEYGIGAVAPGGVSVFDSWAVNRLGITTVQLSEITEREVAEVERRLRVYRGESPMDLKGHCAILVDDGLATGITAIASARYARSLGPEKLVFAAPVSSTQGAELLRREVDEFVALETPAYFRAVGEWYDDFKQTTDGEVLDLLRSAKEPLA